MSETGKPTEAQIEMALRKMNIPNDQQLMLLRAHVASPRSTMPELAKATGYEKHMGANGAYGEIAARIRELTGFNRKVALGLIIDFDKKKNGEPWVLNIRPEFVKAMKTVGWL